MCAVKLVHIGENLNDLKIYEIEEKSYDPQGKIEGLDKTSYEKIAVLQELATVAALNNKAGLEYKGDKFAKLGDPTETALKVAAEKLGRYDSRIKSD